MFFIQVYEGLAVKSDCIPGKLIAQDGVVLERSKRFSGNDLMILMGVGSAGTENDLWLELLFKITETLKYFLPVIIELPPWIPVEMNA